MSLLKIARTPPITVSLDSSVEDVVAMMIQEEVSAVVVVVEHCPKGIFTERDLLHRVAGKQLKMASTPVSSVMTSPVKVVNVNTTGSQALAIMDSNKFHHLPVVDDGCHILGMVSTSHLLHHIVEDLKDELDSLDAYICADGPGG